MLFICKILCFPILGGKNFFAPGKGGGGGRGWGLTTGKIWARGALEKVFRKIYKKPLEKQEIDFMFK